MEEKKKKYEEEPEEDPNDSTGTTVILFFISIVIGILLDIAITYFKYQDEIRTYNELYKQLGEYGYGIKQKSLSDYIYTSEFIITAICLIFAIFLLLVGIHVAIKHNQPKSPTENENKNDQNKKEG